ncbi:hypothetical protein ACFZC6_02125 [Streptomyces ossamyceticus]|uniref:hypothetical protein n=1 Tax=Streptomyces ossamyceticus TaxID=249581 RepID=UPI0036E4A1B9
MSSHTHDLGEWAAMVSLGISVHAAFSVFYFLLVDAHRSDFDPRPWLARAKHLAVQAARMALESGDWDGLLIAVANVKHAVRPSFEACRDAAALLLLLTTSPKGQLR